MNAIDSVIFDLDGTLWDTCASCAVAWNNVLTRNRIAFREILADDMRAVMGKPHDECVRTVFAGLPDTQLRTLIAETMEEDNLVISEMGGLLYPGVEQGLKELGEHHPLFIVSNCQSGYIETFFQWSGLGGLFRDFECYGNTGRPKAENILSVVRRNALRAPVYIGDTLSDQNAAAEAKVPFLFVEYGFGKAELPSRSFSNFGSLVQALVPAVIA